MAILGARAQSSGSSSSRRRKRSSDGGGTRISGEDAGASAELEALVTGPGATPRCAGEEPLPQGCTARSLSVTPTMKLLVVVTLLWREALCGSPSVQIGRIFLPFSLHHRGLDARSVPRLLLSARPPHRCCSDLIMSTHSDVCARLPASRELCVKGVN